MPIYDFECEKCGAVCELLVKANYLAKCKDCGIYMRKLVGAPNINMGPAGATGYYDETLDKYIHTNRQWREEMRKQGVTPKGDTPKPNGEAWV